MDEDHSILQDRMVSVGSKRLEAGQLVKEGKWREGGMQTVRISCGRRTVESSESAWGTVIYVSFEVYEALAGLGHDALDVHLAPLPASLQVGVRKAFKLEVNYTVAGGHPAVNLLAVNLLASSCPWMARQSEIAEMDGKRRFPLVWPVGVSRLGIVNK
jgi:hypothetical protein